MRKSNQKSEQNRSIFWKSDFPKTAIIVGLLFKNRGSTSRKSVKNQSKIDAKSMLEKEMQNYSKIAENGPKNGAKIDSKIDEKSMRKNDRKMIAKKMVKIRKNGSEIRKIRKISEI